MSDLKSLLLCIFLLGVTFSVTNINQKQIIFGSSLEAEYLSPPRISQEVVTPYQIDTSNVLAALRENKRVYYLGVIYHGVFLLLK
jgi:hypothetical protein